ncbi:hypothetical protein BDV18DRAFT_149801 [Aspergillus unguis]
MSSSIIHSCPFCGHVTDISDILADFVGNPHCTQCGLSASEGNMKAQDDLISLFNTHMSMNSFDPEAQKMTPASPPITYSITQHYHHSAHVAQRAAAPEPMLLQSNATPNINERASQVLEILRQHNVDPSSLSSSQLDLFANALPEQQFRLIQMWQICPEPSKTAEGSTQLTRSGYAGEIEMSDLARDCNDDNAHHSAEPYMVTGYELAVQSPGAYRAVTPVNEPTTGSPYRVSSDPIYHAAGQRWWERTQPAAMEY